MESRHKGDALMCVREPLKKDAQEGGAVAGSTRKDI